MFTVTGSPFERRVELLTPTAITRFVVGEIVKVTKSEYKLSPAGIVADALPSLNVRLTGVAEKSYASPTPAVCIVAVFITKEPDEAE